MSRALGRPEPSRGTLIGTIFGTVIVLAVGYLLYRRYAPHIDLAWVAAKFNDYGYAVVFVPVLLESAGLPVPGETTLLLTGAVATRSDVNISVVLAMVIAASAAIIGDNIGYCIGRFGGRKLVLRLAAFGGVANALASGERFFAKHGGKTVFFARWLFGLRVFGSWIAGMTHMPWRTFLTWNALGVIGWSVSMISLGYFFGKSLHVIERVLGVGGIIVFVAALIAAVVYIKRREKRHMIAG